MPNRQDRHPEAVPDVPADPFRGQLHERGCEPIGMDLSEPPKAGGGVKCRPPELLGGPAYAG